MMAHPVEPVIGASHGEHCTCARLDPVTVTVQPVIVDSTCPGQRELPRVGEVAGRVAITWPAAKYGGMPGWGIAVHDADTGEQLVDVVAIRLLAHAVDDTLTVELQRMVDTSDSPIQGSGKPVPDESGDALRTAVLRYVVAEMRVAEA